MWTMLRIYRLLRRCVMIHIPGEGLIQVKVQYERLPTFCYFCGQIALSDPQYEAKQQHFQKRPTPNWKIFLTNPTWVHLKKVIQLRSIRKNYHLLLLLL
ncbi:hypothetical protein M9H77_25897 [Catharanthus roseus]|uniref:Uncharacterized protein n=1 Tax=Catharanthus roseus TaxID=4058 RepID=A0ACC0AA92_CATRO|nr:hypothetical protein M9H77_25897 [Catharanthus roseus]